MLELSLELEPRQEAGQQARQFLADRLRGQLTGDALDSLLAVVSELVNNSFVHGPGEPISVSISVEDDGRVVGQVRDQGDGRIAMREIAGDDGGHGLRIVDGLTERWAVLEGSTSVHFEMPRE
jgi:two-component sensor histidine kinase